jgi:hypothetical protein
MMSPDVIDLIFDNQIKEEEEVIMSIVDRRLSIVDRRSSIVEWRLR